jgi:hypothetical protein
MFVLMIKVYTHTSAVHTLGITEAELNFKIEIGCNYIWTVNGNCSNLTACPPLPPKSFRVLSNAWLILRLFNNTVSNEEVICIV